MGKTSLVLGRSAHAALMREPRWASSVSNVEAPIVLRMLSSEARVDSHALRTGKLQKEDWCALRL